MNINYGTDMSVIKIDFSDHLALVTLNRPEKHNSLDDRMIKELTETANILNTNPDIRAVVLTGAGSSFCSGMDLAYLRKLAEFNEAENRRDTEDLIALFKSIRYSRLPWVAAVNGPAIAGGCGLATACDLIMADRETATFGYTETRIGFIPAVVAGLLMTRVGETIARDLLISGRIVKAESAQKMLLVNELSEVGQVVALAGNRATAIAKYCSRGSVNATKSLMEKIRGRNLDECFEIGKEDNIRLRMSETCKSGVTAFLNKEKLDWPNMD
jgi:methylglutaconyl-CoA hydratase